MYKKGELKEKAELEYEFVNYSINSVIKAILGLSNKAQEEQDW